MTRKHAQTWIIRCLLLLVVALSLTAGYYQAKLKGVEKQLQTTTATNN